MKKRGHGKAQVWRELLRASHSPVHSSVILGALHRLQLEKKIIIDLHPATQGLLGLGAHRELPERDQRIAHATDDATHHEHNEDYERNVRGQAGRRGAKRGLGGEARNLQPTSAVAGSSNLTLPRSPSSEHRQGALHQLFHSLHQLPIGRCLMLQLLS